MFIRKKKKEFPTIEEMHDCILKEIEMDEIDMNGIRNLYIIWIACLKNDWPDESISKIESMIREISVNEIYLGQTGMCVFYRKEMKIDLFKHGDFVITIDEENQNRTDDRQQRLEKHHLKMVWGNNENNKCYCDNNAKEIK